MSGRPRRASATQRRRGRLLAVLLLGLATVVLYVPPAQAADNVLVASEPGDRQELDRPPGFVTLAFEDSVDPSLAKMLVQDASGRNVTTGELIVEGTNMASQLEDGLAPGTYTVTYRLARSDGQPQGGRFQFSYGLGAFSEPASTWSGEDEEPVVLKNPDPNAVTPDPQQTAAASPTPSGRSTTPAAGPSAGSTSPQPSETTSPASSPDNVPGPSTAPSPSPPPPPQDRSTGAVVAVGVVVLLAGTGAGAVAVLRRRKR